MTAVTKPAEEFLLAEEFACRGEGVNGGGDEEQGPGSRKARLKDEIGQFSFDFFSSVFTHRMQSFGSRYKSEA